MKLSEIGVTPSKEKQFNKKDITSSEELLAFCPRKYYDFREPTEILPAPEISCIRIKVERIKLLQSKTPTIMASCIAVDNGLAKVSVFWFHQNYRAQELQFYREKIVLAAGKVNYDSSWDTYSIANPELFVVDSPSARGIKPIYSKISGMSEDYLKEKIRLAYLYEKNRIDSPFGKTIESKYNLLDPETFLQYTHYPKSIEEANMSQAQQLLVELTRFALEQEYADRSAVIGSPFGIKSSRLLNRLNASLPFKPTVDQERVVNSIITTIKSGKRLNMLCEGDVGSGKTYIAEAAISLLSESGYQSVLMAPTLILAKQHYESLCNNLLPLGINIVLLTSELKGKERKKILSEILSGEAQVIVGTSSVIGKEIQYNNLALVIVDEEHKYGVAQKGALIHKAKLGVHSLSLSATPIPKTLSQAIYSSSVQIEQIKSMPSGRIPIKTGIQPDMEKIFRFCRSEVTKRGHQIYVVCPSIDELQEDSCNRISVAETAALFRSALSELEIATLTGKDSKEVQNSTMEKFASGKINILISTTVIEVGVNVPNASTVVIMNAENFGLSTLHQIRGRVARAPGIQGWCILQSSDIDNERLKTMCNTLDGFTIAQEDLKQRGIGEILGEKQSGKNRLFVLAMSNPEEYEKAKKIAADILDSPEDCLLLQELQKAQE